MPDTESGDSLERLSPLVMGGAGFSYQLHSEPERLPIKDILLRALDLGIRAFDTSPYYEPSEQLMGVAFQDADITSRYSRESYTLMTKVGRIAENHFDYSSDWVRTSVARSLQRFRTTYLDVVFCHDVEFVSLEEAVMAVRTLMELVDAGQIRHVGISGYNLDVLESVASTVREQLGRPIDVVQNWAQLTPVNTQLLSRGLRMFEDAGVKAVCSASPLAVGLLRDEGVPSGTKGDWHPAPLGLRMAAKHAASWTASSGHRLSDIALKFSLMSATQYSRPGLRVTTITGISTLSDLEQNIQSAREVFEQTSGVSGSAKFRMLPSALSEDAVRRHEPIFAGVRTCFEGWVDHDLSKPRKLSDPASVDEKANLVSQVGITEIAT